MNTAKTITLAILSVFSMFWGNSQATGAEPANTPNILWISCEDISPHISCFGDPHAITPNIDQLAKEGVRYTNCFTTAGVCAPCRSGIITGMYQTTLGTHHMRCVAKLPSSIKPFPIYLRELGYYCTNNSKTDYQFSHPKTTWDASSSKAHWRNRADKNQPFFAVFNFTGCHESGIASKSKYESVTKVLNADQRQIASKLTTFPPYYPDTEICREDWKRNYELITAMDHWAGNIVKQLKEDGLYENTIIFFWSDHGIGLPRAKRWLYDSGTHVPLVVRIPEAMRSGGQGESGSTTDELISSIDFGPTVLNLAGIDIPNHIQGRAFLGDDLTTKRKYVYGARDRMDERYDIIRMVRDKQFKYIRNYEPLKTYYQYMNTPEKGATMKELRTLFESGNLAAIPARYFADTKPVEELYDTHVDPHELNNLAANPIYRDILRNMRTVHQQWVVESRDLGLIAEPILIEKQKLLGDQYSILRSSDDPTLAKRVATVALAASSGPDAIPDLVAALDDKDPAVRFWGATGLGTIGMKASATQSKLISMLDDSSVVVRVAASRALCRMSKPSAALECLTEVLTIGAQWERLHAAIVLDEVDDQAIPVLAEMKAALKPRPDLYANGKYVVRVLNRAINQLEGTSNTVP
ncbi:MAG: sulfatase-like hydrolase/transferase [Pirellulales bacterium]|nr:sulfatase-like hydrolase/transferase [Pirellulales bacterium]